MILNIKIAMCIILIGIASAIAQDPKLNEVTQLPDSISSDAESTVQNAENCITIAEDRSRLTCFDRFFKTPSFASTLKPPEYKTVHPVEWIAAWNKEKERLEGNDGFLLNVTAGGFLDSITLTIPLKNKDLLVLSCIDKISRIELMLNTPTLDGIIPVMTKGYSEKSTIWMSDDSGYILRAGRGIPSINIMKNLLNQSEILLEFKNKSTSIPTQDLTEKIKLLRSTCTW